MAEIQIYKNQSEEFPFTKSNLIKYLQSSVALIPGRLKVLLPNFTIQVTEAVPDFEHLVWYYAFTLDVPMHIMQSKADTFTHETKSNYTDTHFKIYSII